MTTYYFFIFCILEVLSATPSIDGYRKNLIDIRTKFLREELELGLVRQNLAGKYKEMDIEDLKNELKLLGLGSCEDVNNTKKYIQDHLLGHVSKRNLKVWTDCSTVGNRSHLLVCISRVYDSVYYLTPEEVCKETGTSIDVQKTVEKQRCTYLLNATPL
jgi:hypothetical protein